MISRLSRSLAAFVVAICFLAAFRVTGAGQGITGFYTYTIGPLITGSDLIIFGLCESYQPRLYPPNPPSYTQTVRIISIIKGNYYNNEIEIYDSGGLGHSQSPGNKYVYFLAAEGDGYRFTHQQHAAAALAAAPGRNVQETVENMIAAAIGSADTPPLDRYRAVQVLIGDGSPNPAITAGFVDALKWMPGDEQAPPIAALIVRHYPPALGLAKAFLNRADWASRSGPIMQALGVVGGDKAANLLSAAARPSEPEPARQYAVTALGNTRSPAALPALDAALRDADWGLRAQAAEALGRTMLPGAIPALAHALDDSSEDVRFEAACGLGRIQGMSNGQYPGDQKNFHDHEQQYIQFWKQWAREHG